MRMIGHKHTGYIGGATPAEDAIKMSYPGMAHTAGSGPRGRTCRECKRWGEGNAEYYADGRIKPMACGRFIGMMGKALSGAPPRIPHHALVCRFFDENKNPPIIKKDNP